jgi:hypothetical protein
MIAATSTTTTLTAVKDATVDKEAPITAFLNVLYYFIAFGNEILF